jgi:hypothetical protein
MPNWWSKPGGVHGTARQRQKRGIVGKHAVIDRFRRINPSLLPASAGRKGGGLPDLTAEQTGPAATAFCLTLWPDTARVAIIMMEPVCFSEDC